MFGGPLLVAGRGEIAVRIARTAHRLGIATVAVFSDADEDAEHVRAADVAVRIGPPPARESYLDAEAILDAAARTGARAVHPGYGFLSESPRVRARRGRRRPDLGRATGRRDRSHGRQGAREGVRARRGRADHPGRRG